LREAENSAITNVLVKTLFLRKINNYVLDGDNIRYGLNRDLGFSEKERAKIFGELVKYLSI